MEVGEAVTSSPARLVALLTAFVAAAVLPAPAQTLPATTIDAAQATYSRPASADAETEWTHWTSGRYRITPGDVLEFTFPFVPELNQTVPVQPDGYITLKDISDLRVQGRTVAQVKADVLAAYTPLVRDPVVTVTLKQFEAPYFVASGEVTKPGRYELRGATTLTQALAVAGGATGRANVSKVMLLRRHAGDDVEVTHINVTRMYSKKDLSEDPLLRPGDAIVVPKSAFGKLAPVLDVLLWRR
jgi:protein involved in polysaccharide export with SLBB domain